MTLRAASDNQSPEAFRSLGPSCERSLHLLNVQLFSYLRASTGTARSAFPFNARWRLSLDAPDHHVADHLAEDARRRRQPADHLAIVTVESEGYTNDLTVPAGELQRVGAPADIDRDHLAVMIAGGPAGQCGALQVHPVLLHKAIDPFRVDRVLAGGSPLALEERGERLAGSIGRGNSPDSRQSPANCREHSACTIPSGPREVMRQLPLEFGEVTRDHSHVEASEN